MVYSGLPFESSPCIRVAEKGAAASGRRRLSVSLAQRTQEQEREKEKERAMNAVKRINSLCCRARGEADERDYMYFIQLRRAREREK